MYKTIYFNWEGRGYSPECFEGDIAQCIDILGKEGPFYATILECGAVISTEEVPESVWDLRNYSNKSKQFHSKEYPTGIEGEIYTSHACMCPDTILEGQGLKSCDNWTEVLSSLLQDDESEEEYWNSGNEALADKGVASIRVLSIEEGPYDMEAVSVEKAQQIIKEGQFVEVYLGIEYNGPPMTGLVFEEGKYKTFGLGDPDKMGPKMQKLANQIKGETNGSK